MALFDRALLVAAGVAPEKILLPEGGVPDPFGGSLETYRRTRDALHAIVHALADEWFGEVSV